MPEGVSMAEETGKGMSRRQFARSAALASAVASLAPVNAVNAGLSVPAERTQQPANPPKLAAEGQAEVEARVQSIVGPYGERFSEAQTTDIRRLCTMAQPPLDRLRAYPLQNGDGPALYLKPLVEREKKPAAPAATKPAAASPASTKPAATPAAKPPVPATAKKP
jgi:hypothetical protein